jgi:hypothetical protein
MLQSARIQMISGFNPYELSLSSSSSSSSSSIRTLPKKATQLQVQHDNDQLYIRCPSSSSSTLQSFRGYRTRKEWAEMECQYLKHQSKYDKIHVRNLKRATKFIMMIFDLLQVTNIRDTDHDVIQLRDRILDYDEGKHDFGRMFLVIITYAKDIGRCMYDSILMFGRAMAYMGSIYEALVEMQTGELDPPSIDIVPIVTRNITKNPRQVIFYLTGH